MPEQSQSTHTYSLKASGAFNTCRLQLYICHHFLLRQALRLVSQFLVAFATSGSVNTRLYGRKPAFIATGVGLRNESWRRAVSGGC